MKAGEIQILQKKDLCPKVGQEEESKNKSKVGGC
jgi:hypothetical protein